jgi:hypothetical protein
MATGEILRRTLPKEVALSPETLVRTVPVPRAKPFRRGGVVVGAAASKAAELQLISELDELLQATGGQPPLVEKGWADNGRQIGFPGAGCGRGSSSPAG